MKEEVLETIKKYNMIEKGDVIITGISGGADSCALLHFLCSIKEHYNLSIYAVHINHGIRGEEADGDQRFVEEFCKSLNVPCKSVYYDIKKKAVEWGLGEEEAGRKARYDEFSKLAKEKKGKIAVAHNMNDQAETVIMRMCRGSGIKGIGGIAPVRENIIRPLIECPRNSIEKYCIKNNIDYRTDCTNEMDIYTRNKIRLNILPLMREVNENAIENIARTASIIYEEEEYLESLTEYNYEKCLISKNKGNVVIDINKIKEFHNVMIRRVLRRALRDIKKDIKDISYTHIESINDILMKGTGKKVNLPFGIVCETEYEKLKIYNENHTKSEGYSYILTPEQKIYIKEIGKYALLSLNQQKKNFGLFNVCTKVYDYDKINTDIYLRTRRAGDYITLKNGKKKVKDIFIDCKIPSKERDVFPVLSTDEKAISLVGLRDSVEFYITENTKKRVYFYIWEEKEL